MSNVKNKRMQVKYAWIIIHLFLRFPSIEIQAFLLFFKHETIFLLKNRRKQEKLGDKEHKVTLGFPHWINHLFSLPLFLM